MKTEIRTRQLLINIIMSIVQVIMLSGIIFTLYRFLLKTIGVEQLGIWSVVLVTTSVAGIANLGLSGSVVKFVARYVAKGENKTIADVIQTAIISISVFVGLVLLIVYPFADLLLGLIMPSDNLKEAILILPYALISLWIMIIASVLQSGLDGHQRIDIRSTILIIGALFHLILSFILVPRYGLVGLAYARVIQAIMILIGSWFIIKRFIPILPVFPYKWDRKLFREMISYGLNFQIISITQMICEPTTKVLLTKFGGLTMVGFYEMASRMIQQFRALLVSTNQVLVPVIADLEERNPKLIQNIYKKNYRLMFYIALPIYAIIIALAPSISEIWIGHYVTIFVIFSILLAINLVINTLSVPAYFSYLGIGKLKWNTLGHVITAVMNAILGIIAGYIFGGMMVVIAWIFSSITGSLMIVISYHKRYKIPLKELFPRESTRIAVACLIAIFSALLIYYRVHYNFASIITISIIIFVFSIIVFIPFWLHPMRHRLVGWVMNDILSMRI